MRRPVIIVVVDVVVDVGVDVGVVVDVVVGVGVEIGGGRHFDRARERESDRAREFWARVRVSLVSCLDPVIDGKRVV